MIGRELKNRRLKNNAPVLTFGGPPASNCVGLFFSRLEDRLLPPEEEEEEEARSGELLAEAEEAEEEEEEEEVSSA